MRIKAKLELPFSEKLQKAVSLDEGGKVQMYIDKFVLERSAPYTPGKHIIDAGIKGTSIGSGKVVYDDPSASYLYEGKLMVDPTTLKGAFYSPDYGYWSRPNTEKILDPSNRNLIFQGGGKSGDHWFDRMIEDEFDNLLDGIKNVMRGKE
ncbi:MAG TPA: hypothetical protein DCE23_04420 [Firmicutes bacterium]|nr:hypothetical protein [Bacillota bacterium]